jgi:F0F1-type ATP synthase membrane subunit b/b'
VLFLGNKNFEQIYEQYKQEAAHHLQQEPSDLAESGAEKIVAIRKNGEDDIIAFKTESGRELDYLTCTRGSKNREAGTC